MTDFTNLSDSEIAAFLVSNQAALGCGGLTLEYVLTSLSSGQAVIEARPYGFALVEQLRISRETLFAYLWILFIDDGHRGAGLGRQLVKEMLAKYATDRHMELSCYGERRSLFFATCGFRLETRDGELHHMTTRRMTT
jgi:GNAT superfamily N-acetyltransferase